MNNRNIYDLEELKKKLTTHIDEFVLTLFPNAKKQTGCYRIGNLEGEKGHSLSISTKPSNIGSFYDHADTTCHGSFIQLVAQTKGLSIRDSIIWIANFLRVSPIQAFTAPSKSTNHADLAKTIKPLSERALSYAGSRKISKETLEKYGIGSGSHGDIIFPHYDEDGKLGMLKHWEASNEKKIWTNSNPIHTLFGKDVCDPNNGNDRLIITEGQWDALACYEAGIPAVSIPSGVSNMTWINEDYAYLSHFLEIILLFDNDAQGKEAAKEASRRLGSERCVIVNLPLKDANDMIKAGRGGEISKIIETTLKEPIAEIVKADEMKEDVRAFLRGDYLEEGTPFFIPGFNLCFRPHEITLWFGYSTHGKSTLVQNQIAFLAARGEQTVVASFEQQPARTFGAILLNMCARPNLPYEDEYHEAFDYLKEHVYMYQSRERTDPKHLINTFVHAHRRHGVTNFVVDNVMTLDVDRGDNTSQANAMDQLRGFAANYPIHLHIVAHPRKSPEISLGPPQMSEIRGASEWGDMPDNILSVWRDTSKNERLATMETGDYSPEEMHEFWRSTPCGKVMCRKQRATGDHPIATYFFHKETKRYTPNSADPKPMYSIPPWKE